jgi:hypothetical protein
MKMTAKIAAALHEVMSKVSYVQKTGKNAFHGYKYAGEADLLAVLRPAMVEAGLMLLPSVKSVSPVDEYGNVSVLMEYSLVHREGEVWPEKIGAAGMGNDKAKNGSVGDKGVYKAITGANKYVLFKLFQIETGDDPEASDNAHETTAPTKRQVGINSTTGMATAHALKKDKGPDNWDAFQRELLECETVNSLTKLAMGWSTIAERDKWPSHWRELAKEEINKRRDLLINGVPDDDVFPGDRASNFVNPLGAM